MHRATGSPLARSKRARLAKAAKPRRCSPNLVRVRSSPYSRRRRGSSRSPGSETASSRSSRTGFNLRSNVCWITLRNGCCARVGSAICTFCRIRRACSFCAAIRDASSIPIKRDCSGCKAAMTSLARQPSRLSMLRAASTLGSLFETVAPDGIRSAPCPSIITDTEVCISRSLSSSRYRLCCCPGGAHSAGRLRLGAPAQPCRIWGRSTAQAQSLAFRLL